MQFLSFPEANRQLGPPADMTAETCGTLPVHTDGTTCVSRWRPSPADLAELNAGGSIWLGIRTGHTQPAVFVSAVKPDFAALDAAAAAEVEQALADFAKRLPSSEYAGTRPMSGREVRAHDHNLRRPDGSEIEDEGVYFVSSEFIQECHLYQLRKAFAEGGQPAVVAYLKPYREFLHSPETQPVY